MKSFRKRFEKPVRASAFALSTLAIALPVTAQDQQSSDELSEIVVTGIRASLESAQAIKKNSEQIVDSVTATDIGALPDRSVSEALQRIPGVTLQRTNENRDPARLASEGGGVFIRGLSWVRSETNGRDIFSANSGRNLSYEDVSADLLAGVDVYKNPSAELIEGGIGGIVNLRTRLPFDSDQQQFAVSADYNYADLREEGFVSGNALYSNRWDTGAGEFGALFSFSLGNIGNRTDSIQTGRYEPRVQDDGNAATADPTVFIPNSFGWRRIDWEQKRTAAAVAFQYAPTDTVTMTLQGLYAKADPKDIERVFGETDGGYPAISPSYAFDDDSVVTSGVIPNIHPTADTRFGEQHKRTVDYSFNLKFEPNESWAFSLDAQRIESRAEVLSLTAFTQLGGCERQVPIVPTPAPPASPTATVNDCSLSFDLRGDSPSLQLNQVGADRTADPSAYWWGAAMDHIEDNDAHSSAVRADAEFTFQDNPLFKSFRFGVRSTDKSAITRESGWNWNLLSKQFWSTTPPMYLNNTTANLNTQAEYFAFDNFFRGDIGVPAGAYIPTASLVGNGRDHANEFLRNTLTGGWGWAPVNNDFAAAQPGGDNPNGGINTQSEQTTAAYAVMRFGQEESGAGHWDGNFGVRVVKTEADAIASNNVVISGINSSLADCLTAHPLPSTFCQPLAEGQQFVAGGRQPGVLRDNNYTDVLPSLNLRWFLRDDLQLRVAAAKAIVRPTFSQMQPSTVLSFSFDGDFSPRDIDPLTGSGGNPELKPTESKQFDTSLEWYFAPTGSLTFAGFYKDISNYIFAGNVMETFTSNGLTRDFNVTRNYNGSHGRIQGFEVGYQQFYDRLPGWLSGFGLQANFTYVDSSGGRNTAINVNEPEQVTGARNDELPLEGLSKTSFNLAAMYERSGISFRLAYNWRERYLLTTSAANIKQPVWSEDYGQLDGSVFYNVTDSIKIGIQGSNLLNSRTFLDVGGSVLAPRYSWTDTDRRLALAVRAAF